MNKLILKITLLVLLVFGFSFAVFSPNVNYAGVFGTIAWAQRTVASIDIPPPMSPWIFNLMMSP